MRLRASLAAAIALVVGFIVAISIAANYNNLVMLDQGVSAQWGQVQNVYQRRLDLVPNLVATVKGAAAFEKSTFTAVAEARSAAAGLTQSNTSPPASASAIAKYQQAQDGLGAALSRLMVVVERYPDLKATQNFLDLQAQLEGTENRIAVERMRYNDSVRAFDTTRQSFPTNMIAGMFGARFNTKPYFKAEAAAQNAPVVSFGQ